MYQQQKNYPGVAPVYTAAWWRAHGWQKQVAQQSKQSLPSI